MTDVVPYLMYFAIPVIAATFKLYGIARFSYAVPVGLLAAVSFWFHYRGATSVATYVWNRRPVNVDRAPSRLWDWWDAPYLRGTSRLDALLSPSISVRPAQATVMRQSGDLDTRRVSLELHETRYKRFRWHASVPPGVAVVPAQGEGASRYELAACVPWGDYPPGKHALGKIELLVRWDGRQKGREVLISVPIEVYVLESRHSVYLPLVSLSGGGD
jgi:hypothetical protein